MSLPLEHDILDDVDREITRAQAKHKAMHSAHEAYAVILEELDEAWELIKTQPGEAIPESWVAAELRKELIQVAAMAVRAIEDLGL
jgi:hypothetical protein